MKSMGQGRMNCSLSQLIFHLFLKLCFYLRQSTSLFKTWFYTEHCMGIKEHLCVLRSLAKRDAMTRVA